LNKKEEKFSPNTKCLIKRTDKMKGEKLYANNQQTKNTKQIAKAIRKDITKYNTKMNNKSNRKKQENI